MCHAERWHPRARETATWAPVSFRAPRTLAVAPIRLLGLGAAPAWTHMDGTLNDESFGCMELGRHPPAPRSPVHARGAVPALQATDCEAHRAPASGHAKLAMPGACMQ